MTQKRHVNYSLKPAAIDNAKPRDKAYTLTDGGGLYVEVMPGGSKVWRYKYHRDGKREKVTIGPYPSFSIAQARNKHEELREQLHKGDSPARVKQDQAEERRQAAASIVTFKEYAQRWVAATLFHRSAGYRAQTVGWLDAYVHPVIGNMRLDQVRTSDITRIVAARANTGSTATRILEIVRRIFAYAIKKQHATTNPAEFVDRPACPKPVHHRHLSEKELGAFWRKLDLQGAHVTTIAASKLLLLTMTRKGELLRSKWPEFDLDAAKWDIPAERMKMGKPHRVYLSRQAVEILREVHKLTGHGEYVFPSIFKGSVPMGEVTLNHFFKRIDFGVPEFSPHGTRGTAATLLREHGFERDVVELLLAHGEKNATVAAYSHMELAPERKRALQYLADYTEKLAAGGEVVPLRAA